MSGSKKIRIKTSVTGDRISMVFLPYNPTMWDSMESVYLAAKADPLVDAYVIPIPYYDRNIDLSLGERHYCVADYPEYIDTVDYNDVDWDNFSADAIFIHYPYDEANRVTTIPEMFYSKNLKARTKCLSYIPYFIFKELDAENEADMEYATPYCATPAVVYSHAVFLQSESIKSVYAKACLANVNGGTPEYWDKKIFALGSPKTDRLYRLAKEGVKVPAEWEEKVKQKVIFYNLSLGPFLEDSVNQLIRLTEAMEMFYGMRDKVTVLFRPHPLLRQTIISMRPQLLSLYDELIAWFKKENVGIYDDTADADRAMVLAHAYIGDRSSLTPLFKSLGKPVYMTDPKEDLSKLRTFVEELIGTDDDMDTFTGESNAGAEIFAQVKKIIGRS